MTSNTFFDTRITLSPRIEGREQMTNAELREARLALGLTQAALAASLGVTVSTVAGWERGMRNGRLAPVPRTVELAIKHLLVFSRGSEIQGRPCR